MSCFSLITYIKPWRFTFRKLVSLVHSQSFLNIHQLCYGIFFLQIFGLLKCWVCSLWCASWQPLLDSNWRIIWQVIRLLRLCCSSEKRINSFRLVYLLFSSASCCLFFLTNAIVLMSALSAFHDRLVKQILPWQGKTAVVDPSQRVRSSFPWSRHASTITVIKTAVDWLYFIQHGVRNTGRCPWTL